MQTRPIQLTDVIYNAANQSFEALVTVHSADRAFKYPCAINAPISMPFDEAAKGLSTQALRRHKAQRTTPGMIRSERHSYVPAQRAGRRVFDPVSWLESLVHRPGNRAA